MKSLIILFCSLLSFFDTEAQGKKLYQNVSVAGRISATGSVNADSGMFMLINTTRAHVDTLQIDTAHITPGVPITVNADGTLVSDTSCHCGGASYVLFTENNPYVEAIDCSGDEAIVIGGSGTASGEGSICISNTGGEAIGNYSIAVNSAHALGIGSFAANGAHANELLSFASNAGITNSLSAFACNSGVSNGYNSFSANYSKAQSFSSAAFGANNLPMNGDSINWILSDPLFVIGNGISQDSAHNALTIYKYGGLELAIQDSATIYAITPTNGGTLMYCSDCTGDGITGRIVSYIGGAWRRLRFE